MPNLWQYIDEDTKNIFGSKYASFVANHYEEEKKLAEEFLEKVNAQKHIPNPLRLVNIRKAINGLSNAHNNMYNFYNEPPLILYLKSILGEPPKIPKEIEKDYVVTLVNLYLGNMYGISKDAQPHYENLIQKFDENQSSIAVCLL